MQNKLLIFTLELMKHFYWVPLARSWNPSSFTSGGVRCEVWWGVHGRCWSLCLPSSYPGNWLHHGSYTMGHLEYREGAIQFSCCFMEKSIWLGRGSLRTRSMNGVFSGGPGKSNGNFPYSCFHLPHFQIYQPLSPPPLL